MRSSKESIVKHRPGKPNKHHTWTPTVALAEMRSDQGYKTNEPFTVESHLFPMDTQAMLTRAQ